MLRFAFSRGCIVEADYCADARSDGSIFPDVASSLTREIWSDRSSEWQQRSSISLLEKVPAKVKLHRTVCQCVEVQVASTVAHGGF